MHIAFTLTHQCKCKKSFLNPEKATFFLLLKLSLLFYSVHKIEINGLVGLWRVVSGRRKNILKGILKNYEKAMKKKENKERRKKFRIKTLIFHFPKNRSD